MLLLLEIVRLLALLEIVLPALAGGSILNTSSLDCAMLANWLYNTDRLTALNAEAVTLLNPLDASTALIAASVDSVVLDKLLYWTIRP